MKCYESFQDIPVNNFVNALGIRWNLLSYALNRLIRFGVLINNTQEEKIWKLVKKEGLP